jgi:NTE family protein
MISRAYFFLALLSIVTLGASASTSPPGTISTPDHNVPIASKRPKICLVLSGGGARGAAHVGVIRVLEEMRIPIDCVAGTSMGALVGAAYASGSSVDEMEKRLVDADWDQLLTDSSPREDRSYLRKEEDQARLLKLELGVKDGSLQLPAGAISGQKLDTLFAQLTRNAADTHDFDRLPIPFRAVATDAESGRMVVFSFGRLPSVMRASMSVPGAVAPFSIGERLFLDGGLTRNLPIDVGRQMGADVIIAVNLGTPLLKRNELQSLLGVSLQMINILTEQNVRMSLESLGKNDVLIAPDLEKISSTDFYAAKQAMIIGEAAARTVASSLSRFSLSESAYRDFKLAQASRIQPNIAAPKVVDEIRISGLERDSENEIRRALEISPGEIVDENRMNGAISRVFGLGYFERVNYSLLQENGREVLNINAREKQWGPTFLRFGLSMSADSVGEGRFNLLMRLVQTQFNSAGAEWWNDFQIGRDRRIASQFFQPFAAGSIFSLTAGAEIARRPIDIYLDGKRLAQYDVASTTGSAGLGLELGRNTIARLSAIRANNAADVNIGFLFPNVKFRQGGINFRLAHDSLDNPYFPRQGGTFHLDYTDNDRPLGADSKYRKAEFNFTNQYSFGNHTISMGGRYGRGFGGNLPVFDQFSLGGFLQLSGYRPGELLGQSVAFGRLSYYQRLANFPISLGKNIYAGLTTEFGRVSDNFQSLAGTELKKSYGLFIGYDTFLGPLYLGYGRARERTPVFYFFLGQP